MTDKIVEKVAVQTEESRNQSRRAFLKGSAAVAGGVLFTKSALADSVDGVNKFDPNKAVAPYKGEKEITTVLPDQMERKSLGFGVRKYPYGMPSPYEKEVQRRTLEWLTPDSMASLRTLPRWCSNYRSCKASFSYPRFG
jgi:sulfane dehydrogenase subunit SoxC